MIFQSPSNRIAAQKFLRASMKGYTTFISITQLIAHIYFQPPLTRRHRPVGTFAPHEQ
jgi:hypothetical protein